MTGSGLATVSRRVLQSTFNKDKAARSTYSMHKCMVGKLRSLNQMKSRLCCFYKHKVADANQMVAELLSSSIILRELRRLGIDPKTNNIRLSGGALTDGRFDEIIHTKNNYVKRCPSMYQSMYGPEDAATHWHHVLIENDKWVSDLLVLVERTLGWAVPIPRQVQIISFLNIYNSQGMMAATLAMNAVQELPRAAIPSIMSFMLDKRKQGINPFTWRFRLEAHNSCKSSKQESWEKAVRKHDSAVLPLDLSEDLPLHSSYIQKLVPSGSSSLEPTTIQ